MTNAIQRSGIPWRIIGWGGAVALLAAPFIAMRFTTEVNWTASDFVFAAVLLGVIGGGSNSRLGRPPTAPIARRPPWGCWVPSS